MMIEVFSLATVRERFGTGTPRLSFPTEAPMPNDVDLFVVMAADFRTTGLTDVTGCVYTRHVSNTT